MFISIRGRRGRTRVVLFAVGAAVALSGAAAVPALADGGVGSADTSGPMSSAPLAAAPEVWAASDNSRELDGAQQATFTVALAPGHYALGAKLNVRNNNNHATTVHCRLTATSNGTSNWDYGSTTLTGQTEYKSVSLMVSHTYAVSGPVELRCYHNSTSSLNDATLRYVKLTATRVNAINHIAL